MRADDMMRTMLIITPEKLLPLMTFPPYFGWSFVVHLEGKATFHRYGSRPSTLCARSGSQGENCSTLKSKKSIKNIDPKKVRTSAKAEVKCDVDERAWPCSNLWQDP